MANGSFGNSIFCSFPFTLYHPGELRIIQNRWNTTFEAKGQQYTVGNVIQRLFNTDLYIVSDILLQKDAVAVNYESKSFTKKQIVWVPCGISYKGILVPGSTGVPANMAAQGGWIFHQSQSQCSNVNLFRPIKYLQQSRERTLQCKNQNTKQVKRIRRSAGPT